MKIFVINMTSSLERRRHMENLLSKYGLSAEFIEAVDGRSLEPSFLSKIVDRDKSYKNVGRNITPGEVGCYLSHIKIHQRVIDENLPYALVLEDDVIFDDFLKDFLNKFEGPIKEWDCLLLGHFSSYSKNIKTLISKEDVVTISNYTLGRPLEMAHGTHGYIISQTGAKKILHNSEHISRPIDFYTGDPKFFNVYALESTVIDQLEDYAKDSLISGREILLERASTTKKIRHTIKTVLHKLKIFDFVARIRRYFVVKLKFKYF